MHSLTVAAVDLDSLPPLNKKVVLLSRVKGWRNDLL